MKPLRRALLSALLTLIVVLASLPGRVLAQAGAPDRAEPNYDFATAYRITPGGALTGLNFAAAEPGAVDNDFFVMDVRAGVTYTCATAELGPGVDTNLIVFDAGRQALAGSDDRDPAAGDVASEVTFTAGWDGPAYLLVGAKGEGFSRPAAEAGYSFGCAAGAPTPQAPPALQPHEAGGRPVSIRRLPEAGTGAGLTPAAPQVIEVVVGYDANANGALEPGEGVQGLAVRAADPLSNRALAHGLTDAGGVARLVVLSPGTVRVSIPYLALAEDFPPGAAARWQALLPAALTPGLLP